MLRTIERTQGMRLLGVRSCSGCPTSRSISDASRYMAAPASSSGSAVWPGGYHRPNGVPSSTCVDHTPASAWEPACQRQARSLPVCSHAVPADGACSKSHADAVCTQAATEHSGHEAAVRYLHHCLLSGGWCSKTWIIVRPQANGAQNQTCRS